MDRRPCLALLNTVCAVATDSIVFRRSFFSVRKITHEPLHLARWYFARTCTSTTARTLLNFKVIGQRSRSFFVSRPTFTKLFLPTWKKIVVHNDVFPLSIVWSVPEIFAIEVWSCPKSRALLITPEPLHSAWRTFARTCISTTPRTPGSQHPCRSTSGSLQMLCLGRGQWSSSLDAATTRRRSSGPLTETATATVDSL